MAIERTELSEQQQEYVSIEEAATELGVGRTNVYYYARMIPNTELKKFPLDRRTYISRSDVERIRAAKGIGVNTARIASEDVLVFLAGLGLSVMPHSNPDNGYGYTWFNGDWEGPYPTPVDAIRTAFEVAEKKAQRLRDMPFPTRVGELYWWDGQEFYSARNTDGELQVFTGNLAENDGYESVQKVIERRNAWLQPVPPSDDKQADEERERARLAALWLYSGLQELRCTVEPIDWQNDGLQADVSINDRTIGDLLTVYNRFREDDFLSWLRLKLVNTSV